MLYIGIGNGGAIINHLIQDFSVSGALLVCDVALSFWGGVHPESGVIVDAYHPQCGESVSGKIMMMPSSRGSCTGSAVLLGLALAGKAPAALVFRESEDILTLGAVIANSMYSSCIAVVRLEETSYQYLAQESEAVISENNLTAGAFSVTLQSADKTSLMLSRTDRHRLDGGEGPAVQIAMQTICTMALVQGAECLVDISRAHIDGCIYASPANLVFAQTMKDMGGQVCVPTTMNAISVDYANWRKQGIDPDFGIPARDLADAYVAMGAEPSFSCAPYMRVDRPERGERIAWSESNAVIYANSVLGAQTNKHPDFLDLFMAMTGRVPQVAMYNVQHRQPVLCIDVEFPQGADESFWPLLGWIAGNLASDRIPLLKGLASSAPADDDLKALCAAFGTTSGAAMLHIEGVTPEAGLFDQLALPQVTVNVSDFLAAWQKFNISDKPVDLIALGSPHLSAGECQRFLEYMDDRSIAEGVSVILTVGRDIYDSLVHNGTLARLDALGALVVPDICWCSITRPLFPPHAKTLMTNSGKYAHYGPGLSGCDVLFGSLAECARTASTGKQSDTPPAWLLGDSSINKKL